MFSVLNQSLPEMVAVLIAPPAMIIVTVFLSGAAGKRKVVIMAVTGFICAFLLTWGSHLIASSSSTAGGTPIWMGWFELIVGIWFAYLIIGQVKQIRHPRDDGPAWLKGLDNMGVLQIIGLGIYFGAINVKDVPLLMHVGMSAEQAKLNPGEMIVFSVIIAVITTLPILVPLLISLLAGKPGKRALADLRRFLERYSPVIMGTLFVVFAPLFISKGIHVIVG